MYPTTTFVDAVDCDISPNIGRHRKAFHAACRWSAIPTVSPHDIFPYIHGRCLFRRHSPWKSPTSPNVRVVFPSLEFQVSTFSLICLAVVETRSAIRAAGARTGRLPHGARYGRARALVTASRPALASILIGDATDPVCESVFRSRGHVVDFKPGLSKV